MIGVQSDQVIMSYIMQKRGKT